MDRRLSSAASRSEEAGYPGANGLRVAGFGRNGWPACSGMGGRLGPEQVAGLVRRAQLEEQRRRVAAELGKAPPAQLMLQFDEQEKRQLESNRRYWHRWLERVDVDLQREPERIVEFYRVASFRIEPVGLAYLWPVTG